MPTKVPEPGAPYFKFLTVYMQNLAMKNLRVLTLKLPPQALVLRYYKLNVVTQAVMQTSQLKYYQ